MIFRGANILQKSHFGFNSRGNGHWPRSERLPPIVIYTRFRSGLKRDDRTEFRPYFRKIGFWEGAVVLCFRRNFHFVADRDNRNLGQSLMTVTIEDPGPPEHRALLMTGSEGLDHPWPIIIRDPRATFDAIHDELNSTRCRK